MCRNKLTQSFMCGIVGYIGAQNAYPILIKALKRLEYRGYDSAGVALISDNQQLNVYKTKGKVSDLEAFTTQKDIPIHTRLQVRLFLPRLLDLHSEPPSSGGHSKRWDCV